MARSDKMIWRPDIAILPLIIFTFCLTLTWADVGHGRSNDVDRIANELPNSGRYDVALMGSSDQSVVVTSLVAGEPQIATDEVGVAMAVYFNASRPDLLVATPKPELTNECPWNLDACVSDEIQVKFSIRLVPDLQSPSVRTPTDLMLFALKSANSVYMLRIQSDLEELKLDWLSLQSHQEPVLVSSRSFSVGQKPGDWNSIMFTLRPSKAEGDDLIESLHLNDEPTEAQVQLPADAIVKLDAATQTLMSKLSGLLVGSKIASPSSLMFGLKDVSIDSSDRTHARSKRAYHPVGDAPKERIRTVTSINFEPESYVKYEFSNWLSDSAQREELTLSFFLPYGVRDGLLWLSEANGMKNYIHLNDSRVYYTYILKDQKQDSTRTQIDEIFLNTRLREGETHILQLQRDNRVLTITLNDDSQARKTVADRVRILPSHGGNVYLGGSVNPNQDTNGKVQRSFVGSITQAQVDLDGVKQVDLLQVITNRPEGVAVSGVRPGGVVTYDYDYPRTRLVIAPTSAQLNPPQHGRGTGAKSLALVREPIPITLRGTQSSIVRFDTWDFTIYRSFEIQFMTFEPNGILFFVGPDREHTDFVCLELFDGNLYFVYAVGDHYRHIQLNPVGEKLNTGTTKRVYVSRNEKHQFLVKYNGVTIDVDQGTIAHQTEFATYTYLGSVDQPSRLPWQVWSRENFAGCILSIRVNDDKFLDPSSRMHQHTNVDRGIEFGTCRLPDTRCSREICGGGQCAERSYPFFEPLNFACDCSGSDKTFREGVPDIRRSETCFRDAPILDMDGEKVLLIDFERRLHTMTTHTDDISLQFRTRESNAPLFYAVSPSEKSYFRVDLVNGRIRIQTNINHQDNPDIFEEFFLEGQALNDFEWHTLYIHRRADYLKFWVDGRYEATGTIPLISPLQTFKLVAQQIYLGSAGPKNYARPPPVTSEIEFLPPPPRFVGEFRNFYWNEYDFIGTGQLPNKYSAIILTPRVELPVFPQWPREPLYSISCKPRMVHGMLDQEIDIKENGDMWLIEFKTEYDGVVMSAQDPSGRNNFHITIVILDGRLHIVYSIYGRKGVHKFMTTPSGSGVADGNWHRLVIGLERRRKQISAYLDDFPPESVGNGLPVEQVIKMVFYFGGLPSTEWTRVVEIIRVNAPGSLKNSEASDGSQPALTGCLGGFSLRVDKFATDLLKRHESKFTAYPTTEVVLGYCIDQRRCSGTYCRNGGQCVQESNGEVVCRCDGTGFSGSRCTSPILNCPLDYCQHGRCSIQNGRPTCNCAGTGYSGQRCEIDPCQGGRYCQNGGLCTMIGSRASCDCRGIDYYGPKCESPICKPGYCYNNGRCAVDPRTKAPICVCSSGYSGDRCQSRGCPANFCANGGLCRMIDGRPTCDCRRTAYTGQRCDVDPCENYCYNDASCDVDPSTKQPRCTCPDDCSGDRCQERGCPPNYCSRGDCKLVNGRPTCDCTGTGYSGPRCDEDPCDRYCQNGGVCRVNSYGQPECNCRRTQHTGRQCEIPTCSPSYCKNGGRCEVGPDERPRCDCTGTQFRGPQCQDRHCPGDYCRNNGQCRFDQYGQRECVCTGTGHTGRQCETPICTSSYCANGGKCLVDANDRPQCECSGTKHRGDRCQEPLCYDGYCRNNGACRYDERGQPICDCSGLHYQGPFCNIAICPENHCGRHGRCVVRSGRPSCECYPGYQGDRCDREVCPDNYCMNGGVCEIGENNKPWCRCPINYEGRHCDQPKACPSNYCYHGGQCTMVQGVPQCNCQSTDYQGAQCEEPKQCPQGYCLHGGRCSVENGRYICDCTDTGYRGVICNEIVACPPNYCLFGGVCLVMPGNEYRCDCAGTGRTGRNCADNTHCVHINYDEVGYLIYKLTPSVRTNEDNVTIGFMTYMQSGTLATFLTSDGKYWSLNLRDGRVMIDADGRDLYGYQGRSNDGAYHVLRVKRRGESMIVTQDGEVIRVHLPSLVSPNDKTITYTAIHIGANAKEEDVFRGVIGGVYWNGRYPIRDLRAGKYRETGVVQQVMCPDFPLRPPKPKPTCRPDFCLNNGICYSENYQLKCNCLYTGYTGVRCELKTRGYVQRDSDNGVYIIYTIRNPSQTIKDDLRVAFQTYALDGPIVRVVQTDGGFYDIQLINGQLVATLNGQRHIAISSTGQAFSDGRMHVVLVHRDGNKFIFTVEGHKTEHVSVGFVGPNGGLITREFILGANRNFDRTFDGVIGAFSWNGKDFIDSHGKFVNGVRIMQIPGRTTTAKSDEVVVVLMPHFISPPGPKTTPAPIPLPDRLPDDALHGGVVMPPGKGGAIVGPGFHGAGATGLHPGPGSMLMLAGSALGAGGVLIQALVAGLLLALLLFLSALIWACWRCKPGLCACCRSNSVKSAGAAGGSGMDKLCGSCFGERPIENANISLLRNGGGGDLLDSGYPGGDTLGHIGATETYNLHQTDGGIYALEGMKADNVLITKNSGYFVTSSGMGAPKVWDARTGEEFKVMDSQVWGSTDLHLACNDTVLVSQIIEGEIDHTVTDLKSIRVKRLQLWDFESGRELQTPYPIMCTALCILRSSSHVIVARVPENPSGEHPSILAWDLAHNQAEREIFYPAFSPQTRDAITYLNVSHNDRHVVTGFQSVDSDDQAVYQVFDLSAHYQGLAQPLIVAFNAKVDATEILSDETAVTGTRNGQLLVWSLLTGETIRKIQVTATIDRGNVSNFPPHAGIIHCVQLSADKRFLVTGGEDRMVRVWQMPEERLIHTLEGHADDVLSVAISIDSELVVSGSWDGSIRVWRVRDGSQICWFTSNIEILKVKISNDKNSLVALGEREGQRKLVTLRVIRNLVTKTMQMASGSHVASPMIPPTPYTDYGGYPSN